MLNKCKLEDTDVLFYGTEEELQFPEYLKITTVETDIDITDDVDTELTILSAAQLRERLFTHKRTDDIILSEHGINTYADLKAAYFLIKYKVFPESRSIREKVVKKYSEVVQYDKVKSNEQSTD